MPSRRARERRRRRARERGPTWDPSSSLHLLSFFRGLVRRERNEVSIEPIEATLPERPLLAHPALRRRKGLRRDLVGPDSPGLRRTHEAASFEHFQVLKE